MTWPTEPGELISLQQQLADAHPTPWTPPDRFLIGGVWACFPRGLAGPGSAGDRAWAAALVLDRHRVVTQELVTGRAAGPYLPGTAGHPSGPAVGGRRTTSPPQVPPYCSSTPRDAITHDAPGWRCTSAPFWTSRRSASRTAR